MNMIFPQFLSKMNKPLIRHDKKEKLYTVVQPEQLYLKIQDVLLTNLDEVTNTRFQINDVHHQGRSMLQGIS